MVVVVSNPPGCLPVSTSGFKLARALYSAAVHPAQPEPMITTFSIKPRTLDSQDPICKPAVNPCLISSDEMTRLRVTSERLTNGGRNPKLEGRKPKEGRDPKFQNPKPL